jgi:hypothetical protein
VARTVYDVFITNTPNGEVQTRRVAVVDGSAVTGERAAEVREILESYGWPTKGGKSVDPCLVFTGSMMTVAPRLVPTSSEVPPGAARK